MSIATPLKSELKLSSHYRDRRKMRTRSKHIGTFILNRRRELKLTQEQLAAQMGLSHVYYQALSSIERGRSPFPPKHINKLSIILQTERTKIIDLLVQDFKESLEIEVSK